MTIPTIVQIGDRDVAIETTPLKAVTTSFRPATLVEVRPNCLVLRPTFGDRLFSGTFFIIGIAVLAIACFGTFEEGEELLGKAITAFVGTVFTMTGGWMLFL